MNDFFDMGINDRLCAALKQQGIIQPTEVQVQAIPVVRRGLDAIVQAHTGTGKTLAFLLPVLEKIKSEVDVAQALVVTPTRELAIQIAKVASLLGEKIGVRSLVIYGGQDIERQKQKLVHKPQLIIGTPGRLLDHLRRHTIDLSQVNKVVLDEADEMLHLGFIEDVEFLLQNTASDRQLSLFSATMPDRIRALARRYMRQPKQIILSGQQITLESIEQKVVDTTEDTKLDRLCELINTYQPYLAMVFCHTKGRVAQVAMALARRGYLADELHGDLSQLQRTVVLKKFRSAKLQILVTTDIAARGLDIEGVTHVFNYDLPRDVESYIHRIGRTGRAGNEGMAVTFVNARQYERLRRIERSLQSRLRHETSQRQHAVPRKKKDFAGTGADARDSRSAGKKKFVQRSSGRPVVHKSKRNTNVWRKKGKGKIRGV